MTLTKKISKPLTVALSLAAMMSTTFAADDAAKKAERKPTGYKDTPQLPDQKWLVHDDDRPRPAVVTPAESFSQGAGAPSDAIVLFDGTDLSKWQDGDKEASWKIADGFMEVTKGTIRTKDEFSDFQLHLEFATPAEVKGDSQGRGNSGVIIFGAYEIQVLDSYENETYADGQAGSMYGQFPPLRNAAKKPGEWQSYDLIFEAPRWEGDKLVKKANVTLLHNGVLLHNRKEFSGPVAHRGVKEYGPPASKGPIVLQDHGNPMRFRNIWIRAIGDYDEGAK